MNPQCKICQSGGEIDPSKSNSQNARDFEVSEGSVRRHKKHVDAVHSHQDTYLEGLGIPASVVSSRGKSTRLIDGSWEKVTWQPRALALHQALQYDDLEQALSGFIVEPTVGSVFHASHTDVLNMADLQIGKANQRGGGTPETVARVRQSLEAFARRVEYSGPESVILVDNGDPIENCFNVPSQLVTNDLDVPAQIRVFRRLMIEAIKLLTPLTSKLYVVSVPSNHGAHRTGYKSQGGTTDADFGLEINHQLEDVVAENESLRERVQFVRPEALYETAVVSASGTKVAFHHGHQSNSAMTHGKWWAGQDHGRMPGWDADILVTGHYHTMGLEQSGDGRWIIKTASSDVGSDWFSNRTGESARSGMTAFKVRDGQWFDLALL